VGVVVALRLSTPRNSGVGIDSLDSDARASSVRVSSVAAAPAFCFRDGLMDPVVARLARDAVAALEVAALLLSAALSSPASFFAKRLARFRVELLVGDGIVKFMVSKLMRSFSASWLVVPNDGGGVSTLNDSAIVHTATEAA
jgi:hypothetical protein